MTRYIVIPAFNEEKSIGFVVQQALRYVSNVLVVDDCSFDRTSEIAHYCGASILSLSKNSGYDFALESGIHHALKNGATSILTIDADGQHPFQCINTMFDIVESGSTSISIACRSSRKPRLSESIFSIYTSYRYGISDITSGMKCYHSRYLKTVKFPLPYQSVGTFLTINALKHHFKVKSLSISIKPRMGPSRFGLNLKSELLVLSAFWKSIFFIFL